ncbi:MAG: hypothetical protein M5U09_27365 [Gammaproteobacteria bacterium]|nr:hypothetical protein [Gammaproteobacteria bacterium]
MVYGCRIRREDGLGRALASRVVSGLVRLATGVAVRDANVPYRLMRADAVEDALGALPGDIDLVNVFVAVRQQQAYGIATEGYRLQAAGSRVVPSRDRRRGRQGGRPVSLAARCAPPACRLMRNADRFRTGSDRCRTGAVRRQKQRRPARATDTAHQALVGQGSVRLNNQYGSS